MLKIPSLVFELGRLQVYSFQTKEDLEAKVDSDTFCWTDKNSGHSYGPFKTLHATMEHYTWTVSNQKPEKDKGSVTYVDFRNKKRIDYE